MKNRTRKSHGYSVYQRKDGRWGWAVTVGYLPNGNPQRRQGVAKTQKEATDKAIDTLTKHKTGAHVPSGRDRTVAEYLEEWLDLYVRPHKEPKTVTFYEGMVKNHLVPALGRTGLRKLTSAQIQRMLNEKAKPFTIKRKSGAEVESRLSTETLRGILATLRSALTRAYKDGLIAENMAKRVVLPKTTKKKAQYLSAEQAGKLLRSLGDHPVDRAIVVALHTGLRVGEVTGLAWSDVDFERETLSIRHQLQRINGRLQLKGLKSERSHRTLPLIGTAREAMRAQKGYQVLQRSALGEDFNEHDLVFVNPEGRPLDPKYVNNRLKEIMVKAKLPPMSFHKLRHTAATLMLAEGIPLNQVRDQLGHSQISLTANIYGHAVPTALRPAAEALERAMRRDP